MTWLWFITGVWLAAAVVGCLWLWWEMKNAPMCDEEGRPL